MRSRRLEMTELRHAFDAAVKRAHDACGENAKREYLEHKAPANGDLPNPIFESRHRRHAIDQLGGHDEPCRQHTLGHGANIGLDTKDRESSHIRRCGPGPAVSHYSAGMGAFPSPFGPGKKLDSASVSTNKAIAIAMMKYRSAAGLPARRVAKVGGMVVCIPSSSMR
jgi:hypothetical protein